MIGSNFIKTNEQFSITGGKGSPATLIHVACANSEKGASAKYTFSNTNASFFD